MSVIAKITAMSLTKRRALASCILLAALLAIWSLVVVPLRALTVSQSDWRAETAREIARDRGMLKTAGQVRAAEEAVKTSPLRARLYETSGDVAIHDRIQNDLRAVLLRAGVEPTTFKVLPGVDLRGLRAHRVEFSSVMSVEQLQAFFVALESQPQYLRIERLRLDAPEAQRVDENPRVTALLEVRGFSLDTPPNPTRIALAY